MGMRPLALYMLCLCLGLSKASSPSHTSFISAELQESYHTENGLVQNTRIGHGGGGGGGHGVGGHGGSGHGGTGHGGSEGDGNSESSSTRQPRTPYGAGGANSHNHPRRGAAVHTSKCNFRVLSVSITLSLGLFRFL